MAEKNITTFLVDEKLDRLEAHFKEFKKDAVIDREMNRDVRNALIGSNLNGNKGIVNLLDEVEKRLTEMEKRQILFEEIFSGFKWSIGAVGTGIISFFIWFFQKD